MGVKGIIFDLDGTLLDTLEGIIYTLNKLGEKWGKKFTKNDFLPLWGLSAEEILSKLFDTNDSETIRNLAKSWIIEFNKTLTETNLVKVFPDTYETLEQLKNLGLKIGISTSAPREVLELVMNKFRLDRYIVASTSRDEVEKGKPDPEIFSKTAKKMELKNNEVIIVGDTKFDILAGIKGGFITVLIDHYNRYSITDIDPKPHIIIKNFKDLLKEIKRFL